MMQNKGIFILCFQIIVELSKYTSGFQNGTTGICNNALYELIKIQN